MHAPTGDLPLPVVRLLSFMRLHGMFPDLAQTSPGFTLPANIGDLDPAITELVLRRCNLTGSFCKTDIRWLFFVIVMIVAAVAAVVWRWRR